MGELQRGFGHKPSTLTNVLDRLAERGLVDRRVNPDDRRSFVVATTAQGGRAAAEVTRVLDCLERRLRRAVEPRDVEGVRAVADALARLPHAGE